MARPLSLLFAVVTAAIAASPGRAAPPPPRLLYTADSSGTTQIYALDVRRPAAVAQVTFDRAPACGEAACGYTDVVPSPDGRFIAFHDFAGCDPTSHRTGLFVARADGTRRRRVFIQTSASPCYPRVTFSWSSDSRSLAFASDGLVYVTRWDGRGIHVVGNGADPVWAPRGRLLAFVRDGSLVVARKGTTRTVAERIHGYAWSPTGRWLGYIARRTDGGDELAVVRPDGSGRRAFSQLPSLFPTWSSDGRFLSVWTTEGAAFADMLTGETRVLDIHFHEVVAWKPIGHQAAIEDDRGGLYVLDPATGGRRLLTPDGVSAAAWSPDGRQLAYVAWPRGASPFARHDLKLVSASGALRTLIASSDDDGGSIGALRWIRPPRGLRFRPAQTRSVATVSDNAAVAPWAVTRLVSDGDRVAYVSCGHVFVWTPATRQVIEADPLASLRPACSTTGNYLARFIYSLALTRDRVAWGLLEGNMGQSWSIGAGTVAAPRTFTTFGTVGSANGCAVSTGGLGDLTGGGSLLVFSTWRDAGGCPKARTLEQHLQRADPAGCPCPTIAGGPGPLVPFDVDADRIVAGGENATVVLDRDGKELLSVPVSPLAAQLAGSHLVVLTQGRLREYEATRGALLHAWPLPDVPSAGECGSPHGGAWECNYDARLVLEDAARGLVTYVLDRQVHVLRLADGSDAVVAAGKLARFTTDGLVYADGARLQLVPFASLPLRSF